MVVQPPPWGRFVRRLWDRVSPGEWGRARTVWIIASVALACICQLHFAPPSAAQEFQVPSLKLAPDISAYEGKRVLAFMLREGRAAPVPLKLRWGRIGELLTGETVRRAMRELLGTGRYAQVSAQIEAQSDGVRVTILAEPRRIVVGVDVIGGVLDEDLTLRAAKISLGQEITAASVLQRAEVIRQFYVRRGYRTAQVSSQLVSADDPLEAVLIYRIQPGPPSRVSSLKFEVLNPKPELRRLLRDYPVAKGDIADKERLAAADRLLERQLMDRGWLAPQVQHRLTPEATPSLVVNIQPGPLVKVRLQGNDAYQTSALLAELDINGAENATPDVVAKRVRELYLERGFFDAEVTPEVVGNDADQFWWMQIREGSPLRIVQRRFPCLSAEIARRDVLTELDGVLTSRSEDRADLEPILRAQDVDDRFAWSLSRGLGRAPLPAWERYIQADYEAAAEHLQDLYRADGYLSALVGPARLVRRTCRKGSQPGDCVPTQERQPASAMCPSTDSPLPVAEPPVARGAFCLPDYASGQYCEQEAVVDVPIKLGPRALLWDLSFEGNSNLTEARLQKLAALRLGSPLSQLSLQEARRRLIEAYQDLGYAFASVEVELELSQDRTRGRALFVIAEREAVRVRSVVVRGAKRTKQSVILGRVELGAGDLYTRELVRRSERQIATLGAFSSANISLEDPDVPAREKVVVVEVEERAPQYLDVKPGFSTGDGLRAAVEYGHRNVFGRAIQFRLRLQVGFLPGTFIIEDEVRNQLERLSIAERLERSNTLTLEFPVGRRMRLAIDGVDVRDNSRDFGITKEAAIVTLTHRPDRTLSANIGASFELNDARLFGETSSIEEFLESQQDPLRQAALARLLNVPDGRSFAVALRLGGSWDRRDNPLGATRGTLVAAEVEPVVAFLDDETAAFQLSECESMNERPDACEFRSRFLRTSLRVAGYVPLSRSGLSLAASLRLGANIQLVSNSLTYPDRLFFLGGTDSLRGFLQASVVPEDIFQDAIEADDAFSANNVVIRGGNFLINPRLELRIPLTKTLQTAVFVDAGNVWRELANAEPWRLRYSAGTGLRAVTPIGPLALDYGFKLDRRAHEEQRGAFHFSVGLF